MNLTPEQLREVLWVVFEKDGNDLFCSTHSQLVKDRHQQLIEEFPDQGPYEVRKYVPYVTHADALEELDRVKKAISESCDEQRGEYFGCRRAERAEAALAECRAKLEVDPRTKYDGIDSRDETIRLLENELEESARLHGMGASREAALQARLAESERKCERLKFHADAMAVGDRLAAKDYVLNGDAWNARAEYLQAVKRYRAEFKE